MKDEKVEWTNWTQLKYDWIHLSKDKIMEGKAKNNQNSLSILNFRSIFRSFRKIKEDMISHKIEQNNNNKI